MTQRLQDTIAIVTGGSRGIGAAIAEAFAREGASVVIASRKQAGLDDAAEKINALYPNRVLAKACHIGHAEQVRELIAWIEDQVGTPTVLVNNAATNPYFGPMIDTPEAAWDKTFEVNVKGYFVPTQEVVRRLRDQGLTGSIINVSSINGVQGAALQGVYGMTKAAVISMTQTLALELGADNIRVNAIAPGLVETRLAAVITGSDDLSKFYTERAALKRFGQPHEISGLAVFLASNESSFITGQTIVADGGFLIA